MITIPMTISRKGGSGSGNWGHAGRPGLVGGSGGSGGIPAPSVARDKMRIATQSGSLSDIEEASGKAAKAVDAIEEWSKMLPPKVLDNIDAIYVCENSAAFLKEATRGGIDGRDAMAFWVPKYRIMVLRPNIGAGYRNAFFHEAGHAVWRASPARTTWAHRWGSDVKFDRHTAYAKTDRDEGFAESFMAYVRTDNVAFDARYRATFDAVKEVVDGIR